MTKAKTKPTRPKMVSCCACDSKVERPAPIEELQPRKKSFCSLKCSLKEV